MSVLTRDLRVSEVAAALGLHPETVRVLCRRGVIGAYRTGPGPKAQFRVPEAALAEYRAKQPRGNR